MAKLENNHVYGVVSEGVHIDVSNTAQGAKNYATRHGYKVVTVRFNAGYNVLILAEKINNRWIKYN